MAITAMANKFNPKEMAGMEWPPEDHAGRMANYDQYMKIADGSHIDAFNDRQELDRYGVYIAANLGSLITKACTDLLFGEELTLDWPKETSKEVIDFVDTAWNQQTWYEGALDGAALGDDIYTLRRVDNEVMIDNSQARLWYPDTSSANVREVVKHILAWTIERMEDGKPVEYVRMLIYVPQFIYAQLWLVEDGKLSRQISQGDEAWLEIMGDLPTVMKTKVDDFLLVHVPHYRSAREFYGRSEFRDVTDLFSSLNARLTQYDHVLTNHAEPILEGPDDLLDENDEYDADKRVYAVDEDRKPIRYVTYEAHLKDSIEYIDHLTELILLITETSKDVLGIGSGGSVASGRALKFAARGTLAKVNRVRLNYDVGIKKALMLAQQLKGITKPIEPSINWPDGLPQDNAELMEEIKQRMELRLITRKDAVQRLDNLDDEEAEEMIEEIDKEEQQAVKNGVKDRIETAPQIQVNLADQEAL